MKKVREEQLSAFVDDELDAAEAQLLVRQLAGDEALRHTAMRYSLAGDVIRGEFADGDPRLLSRRVSAAVGEEADLPATAAGARRMGWRRPLAGAAVAATVAVVAILSLSSGLGPEGARTPVVTVPDGDPATAPATYVVPAQISRRAGSPDRLSRYYLNHSQYATMLGGQGTLVRIVRTPQEQEDPIPETDKEQPEDRGD
jgi:sigma-E factor negative regulatory protein RseA